MRMKRGEVIILLDRMLEKVTNCQFVRDVQFDYLGLSLRNEIVYLDLLIKYAPYHVERYDNLSYPLGALRKYKKEVCQNGRLC